MGWADWAVTTTSDMASANQLHTKLKEQFAEKIEDIHTVNVRSYYWREGKFQDEAEVRITFHYEKLTFPDFMDAMAAVHPHKVPMIIAEEHGVSTHLGTTKHVQGHFDYNESKHEEVSGTGVAKELVRSRIVACAQVE